MKFVLKEKIQKALLQPISKKALAVTVVILVLAILAMAGVLYQRYQKEIQRKGPVFREPTPLELLQSTVENIDIRINDLAIEVGQLKKMVGEMEKTQEKLEKESQEIFFINPETGWKVYVNRKYGFQIEFPHSLFVSTAEALVEPTEYIPKAIFNLSNVPSAGYGHFPVLKGEANFGLKIYQSSGKSLIEWYNAHIIPLSPKKPSTPNTQLGGLPAIKQYKTEGEAVLVDLGNGKRTYQGWVRIDYYILKNDIIFNFTLFTGKGDENLLQRFEPIVQTFKFL